MPGAFPGLPRRVASAPGGYVGAANLGSVSIFTTCVAGLVQRYMNAGADMYSRQPGWGPHTSALN